MSMLWYGDCLNKCNSANPWMLKRTQAWRDQRSVQLLIESDRYLKIKLLHDVSSDSLDITFDGMRYESYTFFKLTQRGDILKSLTVQKQMSTLIFPSDLCITPAPLHSGRSSKSKADLHAVIHGWVINKAYPSIKHPAFWNTAHIQLWIHRNHTAVQNERSETYLSLVLGEIVLMEKPQDEMKRLLWQLSFWNPWCLKRKREGYGVFMGAFCLVFFADRPVYFLIGWTF